MKTIDLGYMLYTTIQGEYFLLFLLVTIIWSRHQWFFRGKAHYFYIEHGLHFFSFGVGKNRGGFRFDISWQENGEWHSKYSMKLTVLNWSLVGFGILPKFPQSNPELFLEARTNVFTQKICIEQSLTIKDA